MYVCYFVMGEASHKYCTSASSFFMWSTTDINTNLYVQRSCGNKDIIIIIIIITRELLHERFPQAWFDQGSNQWSSNPRYPKKKEMGTLLIRSSHLVSYLECLHFWFLCHTLGSSFREQSIYKMVQCKRFTRSLSVRFKCPVRSN